MYDFKPTDFGLHLTFEGHLTPNQMANWLAESKEFLKKCRAPFGVLADIRAVESLDKEVRRYLIIGQHLYLRGGMIRSAVIYTDPVAAELFRTISRQSGIFAGERLIHATLDPDWEKIAVNWLLYEKEPREHKRGHSHLQNYSTNSHPYTLPK